MSDSVIEQFNCIGANRYLGPAEILEVDLAERRVRLRLGGSEDDIGVWARIAIASADLEICEHDQALVICDDPRELYVIGILRKAKDTAGSPKKVAHSRGAVATASGLPNEQPLRVFSTVMNSCSNTTRQTIGHASTSRAATSNSSPGMETLPLLRNTTFWFRANRYVSAASLLTSWIRSVRAENRVLAA